MTDQKMSAGKTHEDGTSCALAPGACPHCPDWGYGPPPSKPGLYLARKNEGFCWWHIVVEIRGAAPYLSYRAWDLSGTYEDVVTCHGVEPDFLFGPEIGDVEPPKWRNR